MSADPTHRLTPEWLLELVRAVSPTGRIGLDPATFSDNPTKADAFCTVETNGLDKNWRGHGLVYVNAPYSRKELPAWALKIWQEAISGAEIITLIPARTDTRWWHVCITPAQAICFLRGRPKHATPDAPAEGAGKFPSAVAYYGDRARAFRRVFGDFGWIP